MSLLVSKNFESFLLNSPLIFLQRTAGIIQACILVVPTVAMRILFFTTSLLLFSLADAQEKFVRRDSARCFISVKDFNAGKNVVRVETAKAFLFFSQQDFFGFVKQQDTVFLEFDTGNNYNSEELLRRGRGLVYDRLTNRFADSIGYYTASYGLRHFYLPGDKHIFWVLVFFPKVEYPRSKTGKDHVIRRELRTIPGEIYRCDSLFKLQQSVLSL